MTSLDRRNQVITTLKRYGNDFYKLIARKSKGGGFNDPEIARKAALKMHEQRRQKLKEQKESEANEPNPSADSKAGGSN